MYDTCDFAKLQWTHDIQNELYKKLQKHKYKCNMCAEFTFYLNNGGKIIWKQVRKENRNPLY